MGLIILRKSKRDTFWLIPHAEPWRYLRMLSLVAILVFTHRAWWYQFIFLWNSSPKYFTVSWTVNIVFKRFIVKFWGIFLFVNIVNFVLESDKSRPNKLIIEWISWKSDVSFVTATFRSSSRE